MSTGEVTAAKKIRSFFRFWFPWLIIALGAIAFLVLRWSPLTEEWTPLNRNVDSVFAALLAGILVLLWFLFLSGARWVHRLLVLLVLVALGFAFVTQVREVKFSGDMVPHVRFRWDPDAADLLESQRKAQAQEPPPEVKLSAEPAADFLEYRGPNRDGIVAGPPLALDWTAHPPKQLWRQPVGGGYSGFTVTGNALVTLEQRRDQEVVVCYDTASGRERWKYAYEALFKETLGGNGPRATPTIAKGAVYSLGATGKLVCLDLKSGEVKWSVDTLKDNKNILWGMSGSPLVFEDVVVVNPGSQTVATAGRALVAYDRDTGKEVWHGGTHRAGYSSPMLATLAGQRQILLFDGEGIGGYDCQTGKELWWHEWTTMNGINVCQPVVLNGDRVFVSSAYDVGCNIFDITKTADGLTAQQAWPQNSQRMRCKFASPVFFGGFLYGLDEGYLACLDPATGERVWKGRNYGHGQLLLTGDILVILSEQGKLVLVRATPVWDRKTQNELAGMQAIEGKTWNCFALAGGIAYVRNDMEMAAYDLRDAAGK